MYIHIYIYIYVYTYIYIYISGRNEKPNRTEPAEPNHIILEPPGTGRGTEPNRNGPSHGVSEKRKPNRVEPGKIHFRTEPNRTD